MSWQVWIDRGGTFTDVVACSEKGQLRTHKLLSQDPGRYSDAPIQGILDVFKQKSIADLPDSGLTRVKMGTTVGTNALLEHQGEPVLLLTTRGFKDAFRIAYQDRPDLFALHVQLPAMLYAEVWEVDERMGAHGECYVALDVDKTQLALKNYYDQGYRSLAIVLMHAYRYPKHEQDIKRMAEEIGFEYISVSSEVSRLIKLISRGDTTLVDAYLSKKLRGQIQWMQSKLGSVRLEYMQSNGGVCVAHEFAPKDSILSGPAGGVVAAAAIAKAAGFDKMISFDMGGTSTDVAHFSGEFERRQQDKIAGMRITAPMLSIDTIAAGGGSILFYKQQRFQVGPDSAGAYPGPACYGKQGPLTVTDCNVILGKIMPKYFPRVFGTKGDEGLDQKAVALAFDRLTQTINKDSGRNYRTEDVASGFIAVAVSNMANAIKRISIQKGHDVTQYVLVAFGGAGAQHACLVAERLGIRCILLHPLAGVLSAFGIGIADLRIIRQKSVEAVLQDWGQAEWDAQFSSLEELANADLERQGFSLQSATVIRRLHLKYQDTNTALPIDFVVDDALLRERFTQAHNATYGFFIEDRALVVDRLDIECIQLSKIPELSPDDLNSTGSLAKALSVEPVFFKQCWRDTPVYQRSQLRVSQTISGPAVILEQNSTINIEPDWTAELLSDGNLSLSFQQQQQKAELDLDIADPIWVEIFNNLLMSIADQMGEALVNTAYSVNIKERKDYSCALFDGKGDLIANAPHIPVHLGSMSDSVKSIIQQSSADMQSGDAFMINDPYHGGTHLPDITVITPLFYEGSKKPLFFVASRGHHADVGGPTPGSMPAHSRSILEEGLLFNNVKIISTSVLDEEGLWACFTEGTYPARNPQQNVADLKAQIAANQQGVSELEKMLQDYGQDFVLAYTDFVQENATYCVQEAIASLTTGSASITMDNGVTIKCSVAVNLKQKTATLDFSGSSPQGEHNFHATKAVTYAAILYVFRCLVKQKIPLNSGCLKPLTIILPQRSVLNPEYPAAVVAGNVETSQCVVDVLFMALGILANSQGTMNNVIFGNERYQYYETVCGGMGAGEGFAGATAIQTHMTNSLLTDPEVLEWRYPVVLEDFSILAQSGGQGRWCGGNGVRRCIQFLEPMTVNILSNHRATAPLGIKGGGDAKPGSNAVLRFNGGLTNGEDYILTHG